MYAKDYQSTLRLMFFVLLIFIGLFHWFYTTIPTFSYPMVSSEDGYSRLSSGVAWSSATTHYPINYVWPPLTPIFYSLTHMLHPTPQYLSIRWSAWILILTTTPIIGLIGYRLSKNISVGIASTALALTNPLLINLSTQTLSENIWLPLVGLSLLFLTSRHQKQWWLGIIFWSLSQAVRYESWYLSPLLIIIFWFFHKHRQGTLVLFLSSLLFPAYWYLQTTINTGNFHFYLDEKFLQAKHGSPYIYHHLLPSIEVWLKQLLNSLSPPQILLFLLGSSYLYRQRNHIYTIPIFIFLSLIAQVYFATMEIFPGRYLSILPLLVIPICVNYLHHFFSSSKIGFFILVLALLSLDITSSTVRLNSLRDKVLDDQITVGKFISTTNSPCILYLQSSLSSRFDQSAFWYFSELPMTKVIFQRVNNPYQDFKIPFKCFLVVVEKTPDQNNSKNPIPPFLGQPKFENKFFQVFEPPAIKKQFEDGQK